MLLGRVLPFGLFVSFAGCAGCSDDVAPVPGLTADAGTAVDSAITSLDAASLEDTGLSEAPVFTQESLQVGARTRSFLLSVPSTYDKAKSYPLIYVMHGDGGNGPGLQKGVKFESVSKGDAILVYPNGEGQTWDLYGPLATNKDIAFITTLTDALLARFSIDKKRVFMWGYSNGGFFANQFACRKPNYLRAIAVQSGGAPYEPPENNAGKWPNGYAKCVPDEAPTPAIVFHGTADSAVTFDSGEFCAEYWRYVNQCKTSQTDVAPAPCKKFDDCTGETSVVFCAIQGAGHGIWKEAASASFSFFSQYR